MKKKAKLKSFVLLLIVVTMIPMALVAQNDGFFKNYYHDYYYENRDNVVINDINNGITVNDFGAPLNNGLLIMVATGVLYVFKNRRNEK